MNLSVISVMFEEVKDLIYKQSKLLNNLLANEKNGITNSDINDQSFDRIEKLINEIPKTDLSVLEQNLSDTKEHLNTTLIQNKQMIQILQKLRSEANYQAPQEHIHILDIKSSKVAIALIVLSTALLFSFMGNIYQFRLNSRLSDNDIKYRFIKMYNGIDNKSLYELEDVFEYNPDEKMQQKIKMDVKDFEQKTQQMLEDSERARLKQEHALQLQKEINEIRAKKK